MRVRGWFALSVSHKGVAALAVAVLFLAAPFLSAEDKKIPDPPAQHHEKPRQAPSPRAHAAPRDRQRQEPQHREPDQRRAEPRQQQPQQRERDRGDDRRQPDAERRHQSPHGDGRYAVPRYPGDPDRHRGPELRHPHPNANHFWQERHFRHRDFFDLDVYGYFWFPYDYRYAPRSFEFRSYRGLQFGPNSQLWCQDDDGEEFSCYWPFLDEPPQGCGWYWVPTNRWLVDPDPYDGYDDRRWRYGGWQQVYMCID